MFKNSNMVAEDKQCYIKDFHSFSKNKILYCAKNLRLIIAYIDAKYPNTLAFLDNAPTLEEPAQVGEIRQPIILNEEYIEPVPPVEDVDEEDGC